ncbi:Pimeloyl-ACP methyl ester carboxylesterase [Mucilaginibacter lappiensis]|uniref:Pimeloyl-ACP methyl ester carboxylesterase n=1 Tax=Mucilaginibacter lappiensis TaxID=354630 RepID=A0ABR6PGQ2_9SPHI|nr:alpha/beta hydrolase [Mucilaginibacter lappiensis]MBB6108934.1 pimeloyl-ACP methyl ester carboxylesterase [Mucilaginibacter lappiensis]SIQ68406.1 Pimeloyl-ACP methyl ester carboxylesterase [Mucilaginibacter lappiensis]
MKIQKSLCVLVAGLLGALSACNAQVKTPYGDNAAAGKYYDIRGIKLYTEVYGTGKPLLMIHGNGGSMSSFAKNVPYFAEKYKVIMVDSRAHGKSTDGRDSLSFEMMADDFAGLLDAMHIDSAYVIGWSDGGINALELAMRHPEKVIKLASTGANLWPDSTGIIPAYWKLEQKDYEAKKNTVFKTAKEKNDRKIFLLDWFQPNIKLSALKTIKCPSLIIGGDHDLIPTEHTVLIAQNIPNAYLWIVPNSGHGTLIEHKDEFNKKVDEFFSTPFIKRDPLVFH